jgi:trimethylamine:corrinoid methyltransferase-like protein
MISENFAKLACAIPCFDITGGMMVEPNDIPVDRSGTRSGSMRP